MRKMLVSLVLVIGAVSISAPADAATRAHGCHVLSVTTTQETRYAANPGQPAGQQRQYRTATTTVTKCKGRVNSSTIYGPWHF